MHVKLVCNAEEIDVLQYKFLLCLSCYATDSCTKRYDAAFDFEFAVWYVATTKNKQPEYIRQNGLLKKWKFIQPVSLP